MKNISWIQPFAFASKLLNNCVRAVLAVLVSLSLTSAAQEGEKVSSSEKPAPQKSETEATKKKPKAPPKKLTGAELYSIHCNRCHPERYPTERTAAQWKTILLHMRVRANLPAEQSRTILTYLQDNSGR